MRRRGQQQHQESEDFFHGMAGAHAPIRTIIWLVTLAPRAPLMRAVIT
jgi:hypothetical protein